MEFKRLIGVHVCSKSIGVYKAWYTVRVNPLITIHVGTFMYMYVLVMEFKRLNGIHVCSKLDFTRLGTVRV